MPCWLVSPGDGDLGVAREFVACDPVVVVRGSSVHALGQAWEEARLAWRTGPDVPVGMGYLSYDLARQFMPRLQPAKDPTGLSDIEFRFYDAIWVRDAVRGTAEVWAQDEPAADRLLQILNRPDDGDSGAIGVGALVPDQPVERHLEAVKSVLDYLRAGDVYQVNLARRLSAPLSGKAARPGCPIGLALFEALQRHAPGPHGIWLADPEAGTCLVGNSPERFLRTSADGWVQTRPIKGTRPRGATQIADAHNIAALKADPKECAEHVMIVDLERNDLGRVCETGSIEVTSLMRVVSLPTVHHLVSTVRGRLRSGVDFEALMKATFPSGSVTGAPKLRAMEIIAQLEPGSRGPYTGATGWLGAGGDMDLAVAIRTAVLRDGRLSLWVGGGIVIDSLPHAELRETEAKAEAFARLCRG